MKGIAREANVSPTTVYAHFKSKSHLLARVMERLYEQWTRAYEAVVYDASKPFDEKLSRLSELASRWLNDLPGDLYDSLLAPQEKKLGELAAWYAENRFAVGLEHLIREGRKEGRVSIAIDDASLIMYFRRVAAALFAPPLPERSTLEDMLHLFIHGITGKPD